MGAGECTEDPETLGVFSRVWSGGEASVDCNALNATLDFKMLAPPPEPEL